MTQLKTLIVGGGIAGLSCAIALRKSGHYVDLVEIQDAWRATQTGITLQAHTFRALAKVNVAQEVARFGYASRGARVRRADGTLIRELTGQPLGPGLPVAGGIMRPVLNDILLRQARASGANIALGTTIERMSPKRDAVDVELKNGTRGSYDVIIGADGISSSLRATILPDAPSPEFTGQGSFRKVAPRPAEIDMMTMYLGKTTKAGVTPASDTQVFLWTLTPEANDEYMPRERQLTRLKEALAGFGGVIGDIRDTLNIDSEIIYRPLKALIVPKPWHVNRVVLIGDAVHATTPHLASGASAAIEDAWLLAEYLTNVRSVGEALRDFTERRYLRCRFVVETSRRIGELETAGAPSSEQEELYVAGVEVLASPA